MNCVHIHRISKAVLRLLTQTLVGLFLLSCVHAQTARFLGVDSMTLGNWKGVYGKDGYKLAGDGSQLFAVESVSVNGALVHYWAGTTTDQRGLIKSATDQRLAATWYAPVSFDAVPVFSDNQQHRISIYCVDWENLNGGQTVEIRDAATDALLDSRTLSSYVAGTYLRWNISGNVIVRFVNAGPRNAVVSGIFFDPPTEDPIWWSTGIPPVIDPTAETNNHGVANIGQAKWMVKNALEALREKLPLVADLVETDLVGAGKPIASWNAPTTPEEQAKQRAPLLIGQLKAIAAPFYTHLNESKPEWLLSERVANGTAYIGTYFPWSLETTDDNNKGAAVVGQLKSVFSLRFETLESASVVDHDLDGIADEWEVLHFGDLSRDGTQDFDGDGLTDLQEYEEGSNPKNSSSNSGQLQMVIHTHLE